MKFISVNEYLMGKFNLSELSDEIVGNINTLIPKVNELLEEFGQYRKCNSGLRTKEDQLRINPKSMNSAHLVGLAIDLEDKNGKLDDWCMKNQKILKDLGLYLEHPDYTINWCHIQARPPKSNKTVFIP